MTRAALDLDAQAGGAGTAGVVFNLQKYSIHDGPGIRTTVFLKGCPLCCQWCHNPESQSARPEVMFVESRCVVCGECRRVCAFAQSTPGAGPLPPRVEGCNLCGACVAACPTGARQILGQRMTVGEVLEQIAADSVFHEESGGGVTFSGGEPLSQWAFLRALLQACRSRGIHTAVDTCGFGCTDALLDVARLADLILFDLKLMDDARHLAFTGVSNEPILANLKVLDSIHRNLWIRVPLIPGINDDTANLEATARLVATLHGVAQVCLLPYHAIGATKFRRLGRPAPAENLQEPSREQVQAALDIFKAFGLRVAAGG